MSKRAPTLIVVLAVVGVAAGLFWMFDSGGSRSDRQGAAARSGAETRMERSRVADGDEARIADAATLAQLIKRYGGFETTGRIFLTRPTAPGEGLDVVLSTELDGHRIEGRAKSDSEGRFAVHSLPRGADYQLVIDGESVQPYRDEVLEPAGSEVDLSDLYLDRFYFLSGKVVSGSGIAVADAEVAVVLPNGGQEGFSWRANAESASREDLVAAFTKTGGDGTFTIKLEDPGIVYVRVRAEGWAPHYRGNIYVAADVDTDLKLALTRGIEIGGMVIDANGRPLPGAVVSLFANSRDWWNQVKELRKTDDDGRFDFRFEQRSDRYRLRVMPPDGVDVNREFRLPLTEELVIRMPGGATLKGRVVDVESSQPIANAEIIVSLRGPGSSMWRGAYQKALKTDSYGVFRLVGVGTDGLHSMAVSAPGYAHFVGGRWSRDAAWQELSKVKFTDGVEVQLPDVPLKRGRVVEGVVRDAETREPIVGAKVVVNDMIMGNRTLMTGSDGTYRVDDVGDRISLSASAMGYVDVSDNPWRGAELPADQDIIQRDFDLLLAGTVSGTVRTSAGQPVARALVRLRAAARGRGAWTADLRLRDLYTHTDEQGRYTLGSVPPVKLKAEATVPGFVRGESEEKTIEPGATIDNLDVKLVNSATMSGIVVERGGGMVGGARITIAKDPGTDDAMSRWRMMAGGTTAFTDDKGRFLAEDVPTGDVILRIEAEGQATQTVHKKNVKPGSKVTGMKVTMKPALEISGKIVNEEGEPVTRSWVRARQTSSPDGEPTSQMMSARVQQDGSFTLRNIPEGGYTLEVSVWSMGRSQAQYENLARPGVIAGTKDLILTLVSKE